MSTVTGVTPDARDRRARLSVAGAFFVQGLCFASLVTRIPAIQSRHGFTDEELSLVLLAVPVFAGLGSVLAGVIAARLGSALALRASGVLVCLAVAGVGWAPGRPALYAVLVAFGLAVGVVDAAMNMQGVAVQGRYGRSILASFHAVWSVAGLLAAVLASVAAARELPLAAHLSLAAGTGVVLALLAGPGMLRRDEIVPSGQRVGARVPWRPVLLIGLAMMFMYIADASTANWHGPYLKSLGGTEALAPLAYFAYQGCMLLGRLAEHFGPVRTVVAGAAGGAAGLGLVVAAGEPWLAIAGFGVLGLGLCAIVPQSFTAAASLDPDDTGVAIARVNLFNYAGFVIGAPLVGLAGNLRLGFAITLVLVLGIIPLARAFTSRPARGPATPG